MPKGAMIGRGMTAEVYEWEKDKVLKLYYHQYPHGWVDYEANIGSAIYKAGVPAPATYELIEVEGRKGIIYQRIPGKSMLRLIEAKPWKSIYFARQMAHLHWNIHNYSSQTLPAHKDKLIKAIQDSADLLGDRQTRILEYLERLPSGASVCHGDFHPDNILVSDKEAITIDWMNAYSGNQLSDVARTCLMLRSPYIPPGPSKFMTWITKIGKYLLYSTYLNEYLKLGNIEKADMEAWMLPVAAARLREKVPGEEKWLLEMIDKHLNLLD